MHQNIFLSVIIPVYNAKNYLPFCLDSILATGREDIEIVLVDDGSTDGSAALCTEYQIKHSNIIYLYQTNSGPSAARNKGLEKANGKYVAFVDADDYIEPVVFSRHLEFLRNNSADIWASDFTRVADNGCVLDKVYQIQETSEPIVDNSYLPQFLEAKDCVWNVWRYIFSKDFLDRNSLCFAEGYSIAEDLEFVVRALSCDPKITFFHKPYYFYRVNYGASLTRLYSSEKIRQLMVMFKLAMSHLGDSEIDRLIKAKLAREYILNLSALYEVKKADRPAVLKELNGSLNLAEPATGAYKYAAKAVNLLGVTISARLLYMMKRMKRLLRGIKTNLFNRGLK